MSNETIQLFFPLKIIIYHQYDCSEDDREEPSPAEEVSYEDQILAAIAKEYRHFKNECGLDEYFGIYVLKEKVRSLHPSVEVWHGKLLGVMTAHLNSELTAEETAELISRVEGQNSDAVG